MMPPIEWGSYLLDYLFEMGPTMAAGMGSGPLTFMEMEAWQRTVGIDLSPLEVRLLRRLSNEYLGESYAATKRDRPAPYGTAPVSQKARQKEVDRNLDLFLG
jgi:hypothetical protein